MAIDPTLLNAKQCDPEAPIRTGVYVSQNRKSAVVVKVKGTTVHFLTMHTGTVRLESLHTWSFRREYDMRMPNYPALRALRKYNKSGLPIEAAAERVIRAIL